MSSSCDRIGSQLPLSGDWANAVAPASTLAANIPKTSRFRTFMTLLDPALAESIRRLPVLLCARFSVLA